MKETIEFYNNKLDELNGKQNESTNIVEIKSIGISIKAVMVNIKIILGVWKREQSKLVDL